MTLLWIITGVGVAYSAFRTGDLLIATLPGQWGIIALGGVVIQDLGLLAWVRYVNNGARGKIQREIAQLMVVVNLAGVMTGVAADTIYNFWLANGHKTDFALVGVITVTGVVLANIASVVICHLFDVEKQMRRAEQEAQDDIEQEAIRQITEAGKNIAAELAYEKAAHWMNSIRTRWTNSLTQSAPHGGIRETLERVISQHRQASPEPSADGGEPVNFTRPLPPTKN